MLLLDDRDRDLSGVHDRVEDTRVDTRNLEIADDAGGGGERTLRRAVRPEQNISVRGRVAVGAIGLQKIDGTIDRESRIGRIGRDVQLLDVVLGDVFKVKQDCLVSVKLRDAHVAQDEIG